MNKGQFFHGTKWMMRFAGQPPALRPLDGMGLMHKENGLSGLGEAAEFNL